MGSTKVAVKHQPKKACAPSKPAFGGNKFGANWSFKGTLSAKKNYRAQYFAIKWVFKYSNKTQKVVRSKSKLKVGSKGSDVVKFTRASYYPYFKSKRSGTKAPVQNKLRIVSAWYTVWARNTSKVGKKNRHKKKTSEAYSFQAPNKPTYGDFTFDQFSRTWSCPLYAAESKPPKERIYTFYNKRHKYSWETPPEGKSREWKSDTTAGDYNLAGQYVPFSDDGKAISHSLPATFDTIGYDGWALIKIEAYSAGMGGDSTTVPKYRVFSYPDQVAVKSVDVNLVDTSYAWNGSEFEKVTDQGIRNGIIVVNVAPVTEVVKEDEQNLHPIDSMTLQVLRNSTIKDPLTASLVDRWDDVDSGNASTRAFTDMYADSRPDAGRTVWYRVRTIHDHLERYSMPYRATGLEWELGKASLIDAIVVDDGINPTGIKVLYGYNADHMDGTLLEWATTKNAFNSNNPPSTATHDKKDANVHSKEKTEEICNQYDVSYNYTSEFYITGLTEGAKYYISARRYQTTDNGDVYGPRQWYMKDNNLAPVIFARKPEDVSLTVPAVLTKLADGAEVSWNFSASVKQAQYTLYYVKAQKDAQGNVVYKDGSTTEAVTEEKAFLSAKTEKMFVKLDENQLNEAMQDGHITLRVSVSCGGPEAKSSNATITVATAPELSVRLDTESENSKFVQSENTVTLTSQGGTVQYQVDQPGVNVFVSVVALGKVVDLPDGELRQFDGDVLYTGVLRDAVPREWTSFTLPRCEFLDAAKYAIRFIPVSQATGLHGVTRELTFGVEWAHQAKPPSETSYILGDHTAQSATIFVFQPDAEEYDTGDGFVDTDVCDIYRLTPDGACLIARGVAFGHSVTDPFAPFSNHTPLQYRLVTRTADGDYDWSDVSYSVRGHSIRFDWKTDSGHLRTVSLPYNLRYSDKWAKQFESARDLSGGKTGWWLPGVDRTSSLSTDMVRLDNFEDQALVRELANYAGPVLVRTPNGCAYAANVNVSGFPNDYDKLISTVQFEAEEIDMVPEFTIQEETIGG